MFPAMPCDHRQNLQVLCALLFFLLNHLLRAGNDHYLPSECSEINE